MLKPVVARYQGKVSRIYFRADAGFANPEVYEYLEGEGIKYAFRLPANRVLAGTHRLSAHAPGRPTAERCPPLLCELRLSGGKLDEAAPCRRQGRMASWRTLSARRLHRHHHGEAGGDCRRLLQQARDLRTVDQRGQGRDPMDAAFLPSFAANAVRLQLHALAYSLGNFLHTLATPEPIKDWSPTSLKEKLIKIGAKVVSHGRYVGFQMAEVTVPQIPVRRHPAADRGTAAAAAPVDGVKRSMSRVRQTHGEMRLGRGGFGLPNVRRGLSGARRGPPASRWRFGGRSRLAWNPKRAQIWVEPATIGWMPGKLSP